MDGTHDSFSETNGNVGNVCSKEVMDAKRRIQQRLVAFVNEQAKATEEASRIEAAWKQEPVAIQ